MRLRVILRRLRRSGLSSLNPFSSSAFQPSSHKKHVKIDDEDDGWSQLEFNGSLRYQQRQRLFVFRMLKMVLITSLVILFLLGLIAYMIYKPPSFVINYLQRKYPDVLFQVEFASPQRAVALTLDDAPSDETGKILDLLKAHHAKATFFVIGNQIQGRESILQRIHDEGHEIGNHAWADEPSVKLPILELQKQIEKVEHLIPANSNKAKYFRPGSGFFNSRLLGMVSSMGYRTVLGGIYPHDPQIHNPTRNANHVLSMVRPGGIIIMHDRRSYSARQLELVLKGLWEDGWVVESVGGLLKVAADLKSRRPPL